MLLEDFLHSGYQAIVVRVREEVLDETWLGRLIDESLYPRCKTETYLSNGKIM